MLRRHSMSRQVVLLGLALLLAAWLTPIAGAQDDIADVADKGFRVKKNNKWMYFEIESAERQPEPADGYKLLVVLPGGDGGRDFMPFVKRIYKNGLTPDYLVVELVAPKWAKSEQVVWPTATDGPAAAKIATEKFIVAVVEEVAARRKIDRRHVFALGWSSGGPAVYAAALEQKPVITGAFAAMSVFHPDELDLSRAKGRPFFILHSPEDDVCPMRLAEEARDTLTTEGAAVEFLEYEGGHGWRGNVYGNISAGIRWLEEQTRE